MTHTEINDFLGGVFTLQNGVRKNVRAHGGKWPPLGPPWGPQYLKMGAFSPMGAPISNDGGSNMPIGEINGHQDELCTVLPYKASSPMDFPHGGIRIFLYMHTVV